MSSRPPSAAARTATTDPSESLAYSVEVCEAGGGGRGRRRERVRFRTRAAPVRAAPPGAEEERARAGTKRVRRAPRGVRGVPLRTRGRARRSSTRRVSGRVCARANGGGPPERRIRSGGPSRSRPRDRARRPLGPGRAPLPIACIFGASFTRFTTVRPSSRWNDPHYYEGKPSHHRLHRVADSGAPPGWWATAAAAPWP